MIAYLLCHNQLLDEHFDYREKQSFRIVLKTRPKNHLLHDGYLCESLLDGHNQI